MSGKSALEFISKNLRNDEFFLRFAEVIDIATQQYKEELADVRWKYQDATQLREEAIKAIIDELGFDYIRKLMDTLTNVEFNALIDFLSLLNLLKGSRRGLEIVLRLVGLDSIISEWWEVSPQKEAMTFDLTVIVTNSIAPDLEGTLDRVKIFVQHYVLPKLDIIEFVFILGRFLEQSAAIGGFVRYKTFGRIVGKI